MSPVGIEANQTTVVEKILGIIAINIVDDSPESAESQNFAISLFENAKVTPVILSNIFRSLVTKTIRRDKNSEKTFRTIWIAQEWPRKNWDY